MEINNLYYGILLYIIIVASLVFIKPDFIYDNKKSKYKEYGTTGNKTIFTLPIISVLLALLIAVIVATTSKKETSAIVQQNPNIVQQNPNNNIQYVPVYYHQPIQQPIQQLNQFQPLQPFQQIQPIQQIQPVQYVQPMQQIQQMQQIPQMQPPAE